MVRGPVVAVMALVFILPLHQLRGQGRDVKVLMRDGTMIEGELVCVQDSSLLVAVEKESVGKDPLAPAAGVRRIPTSEITVVTVEGSSHVLLGMGLGLAGGVIAGAVIGSSQNDEPNTLDEAVVLPFETSGNVAVGALIGGLGGLALGAIIGSATSVKEYTVTPHSPGGMASLSQFARYPDGGPEFLKARL